MLDYELALKLKNAGFSQGGDGQWDGGSGTIATQESMTYVPTLSELIEACLGNGFFILQQAVVNRESVWQAKIYGNNKGYFKGSTPEEAVANLWLSLQDKH